MSVSTTTATSGPLAWIRRRAAEPSTWAGLAAVVAAIAPYAEQLATATTWETSIPIAFAGIVAIVKAEGGNV